MSPRTRNRARARSASLRWYWRSTRWRRTPSRRYEPPVAQLEDGRAVVDRRADAVDAAHARDDDHVAALEQGVGRGVPQPVDLVVAARVLLDVRVAAGQVRLGLVVVEVADEVLDRVVREEVAELRVELRGEGLVVGEDEGRALGGLDRPWRSSGSCRSRSRRAGPGGCRPFVEAVGQALDGLRLVAGGLERGDETEIGHVGILPLRDRNRTRVRAHRPRSTPGPMAVRSGTTRPYRPRYPRPETGESHQTVADRASLPAIRPSDRTPAPGRHARPRWRWSTRTRTGGASS